MRRHAMTSRSDPHWKNTTAFDIRIPGPVYRRLKDICQRRGISVGAAVRMTMAGFVQHNDLDWSPWDVSETDNGYMPYEAFKKRLEQEQMPRKPRAPRERIPPARHVLAKGKLLTLAEVSEQFKVTQRTAYRWHAKVGEGGSIDDLVQERRGY
jgi:hypothetical protein